jgi:hypothetical protein
MDLYLDMLATTYTHEETRDKGRCRSGDHDNEDVADRQCDFLYH